VPKGIGAMLGPEGVAVEDPGTEKSEAEFWISIWTGVLSLLALVGLLGVAGSVPFALALSLVDLGAFAIVVGGSVWKVVGTGRFVDARENISRWWLCLKFLPPVPPRNCIFRDRIL